MILSYVGSKCCLWVNGLLHPCVQSRLLTETQICVPTRSLGSIEVTSQGLKQVSLPMLTSSPAPSPLVLLCAHFTNGCITLQLPKPETWRSGSPLRRLARLVLQILKDSCFSMSTVSTLVQGTAFWTIVATFPLALFPPGFLFFRVSPE